MQVQPTSTPIFQTATFAQPSATSFGEYDYSRSGNPTRAALEAELAKLESGGRAFAFASGMAAITSLLAWLQPGDRLLAGSDLYGGTIRLIETSLPARGVDVEVVDTTSLAALEAALVADRPGRTLLYFETPSNPLLRVTDIAAAAALAKAAGAAVAIDNTMLSPHLQQPLALGADVVLHSATKHLGGHGDVTAGCCITAASELGESFALHLAFTQNATGNALAPFDAWLVLRGLKTLGVRLDRECASALQVARFLQGHSAVRRVHYPGLPQHPDFALSLRQASGAGSVVSFETGVPELSRQLVEASQLFTTAVSFGSVASSISLPCFMSHASVPADSARCLPPRDLVRLSVGLESPDALIADLKRVL